MSAPVALQPGGGESAGLGSLRFTIKAASEDTNGAYSLIEASGPVSATPHIHHTRDEAFFVLEGSLTFLVGEQRIPAEPGSFLLGPRGVLHGFRSEGESRLLLVHSPGGFERFFRETFEAITSGDYDTAVRDRLAEAVEMTYVDDVTI